MSKYYVGNMWEKLQTNNNEMFVITTNNVIKKNGGLVMGAGVALQATKLFPYIEEIFGRKVLSLGEDYLFFVISDHKLWNQIYNQHVCVAALQTKYHFKDNSNLCLIKRSLQKLNEYVTDNNIIANCPMPGVGNGNLNKEIVKKITDKCSDNIRFWTYD